MYWARKENKNYINRNIPEKVIKALNNMYNEGKGFSNSTNRITPEAVVAKLAQPRGLIKKD